MRAKHLPGDHPRDGRDIDPEVGSLLGEGAQQRVRGLVAEPEPRAPDAVTTHGYGAGRGRSYYETPLLKEPVWRWWRRG